MAGGGVASAGSTSVFAGGNGNGIVSVEEDDRGPRDETLMGKRSDMRLRIRGARLGDGVPCVMVTSESTESVKTLPKVLRLLCDAFMLLRRMKAGAGIDGTGPMSKEPLRVLCTSLMAGLGLSRSRSSGKMGSEAGVIIPLWA